MEGIFTIIWLVSAMNGTSVPMNGPQARQNRTIGFAFAAARNPQT
jgi:hypothetical protein